eukprot:5899523-Prymnesium_polylepis.1
MCVGRSCAVSRADAPNAAAWVKRAVARMPLVAGPGAKTAGSGPTGGRVLAMYWCRMRRRGVWRWPCAAKCRRASVGRP